jgi:outer membrane protein OmpA-like peptidoglycan-associated protein
MGVFMKKLHFKIFILALGFMFASLAGAQESAIYFSPNGDGVKDKIRIPLSITDSRFIKEWHFIITDEKGTQVWSAGEEAPKIAEKVANWREILASFFEPKQSVSVPSSIVWDGKLSSGRTAPDGIYYFYASATDDNGNYGESFRTRIIVDTVPPSINVRQPASKTFGTIGGSTITIEQSGSREDKWVGEIRSGDKVVRTFTWTEPKALVWDGKDDRGFVVPEGDYDYTVSATDAAGNKSLPAGVRGIHFETITPSAESGRAVAELAPNGRTKTQTFNIQTNLPSAKIDSWSFSVLEEGTDQVVRVWSGSSNLNRNITWDGKRQDTGNIAEGNFKGDLKITVGGKTYNAETPSFVCTGLAPVLTVRTTPELFSPDGDGENDTLTIDLGIKSVLPTQSWAFTIYDPNGKPFWAQSGGAEVQQKLLWDGKGNDGAFVESAMSYPYTFTATDSQGQESTVKGRILVDVLVIRDGNQYKIRVPAIIFRANNADFVGKDEDKKRGLDEATIAENERVLKRIADILQKFRDYNVRIEGHANSETGSESEEIKELIPLSTKRAEFVKTRLIAFGINGNRLIAEGMGGRNPVVKNRKDRDNVWKNRRVEFILNK